jgi:hypothetical protein
VLERVLAELESEPFDPVNPLTGAGDALGRALDLIAFESDADLARAREVLFGWWRSRTLGAAGAPASTAPDADTEESSDTRSALAAFDAGRAAGEDLEALFGHLEADLGLDSGDEPDTETAPDFPGVVAAVVEEFLWELGREQGEETAERHAQLRELGSFATQVEGLGVFENLGARELGLFASSWAVERGLYPDASSALAMLDALAAFCAWVEQAHEHPLVEEFTSDLEELRRSLPRLAEANSLLGTDGPPGPGSTMGELELEDGTPRVAGRTLTLPEGVLAHLEGGDLVRVRDGADGALLAERCFPPSAGGYLRS